MKRFLECTLVTICYWLAIFIGPAILLLWNNLSYYVSGFGYGPESLMYKVLTFISQPVSCFLATSIAISVGKKKHNLCVLTNCIFASIFCAFITVSYVSNADYGIKMWATLLSAIACITTSIMTAKEVEETMLVLKIKNIFGSIFTAVLIWAIARFIPGVVGALFPEIAFAQMIAFIVFLPIGWKAAKSLSKGNHNTCVRVNLYIFAIIEISGLFTAVTYLMQSLSLSTGRYSTDAYGVPYSEYVRIYGTVLIFQIIYIVMCFVLAKKTPTKEPKVAADPIPVADPIPIVEENNHGRKQELRAKIEKLKNQLKESDETYETNRKILEEAFTDEELDQMVANGEFPADKVEEYRDQRRSLEMLVAFMPTARKDLVRFIGDATKELAELECE